jgi:hypothetical protein
MKQTAVEWLISIIERYIEHLSEDDLKNLSDLFEQAKEMEKQQIKSAYFQGCGSEIITSEEYYKQTFKSKQDEKDSTNGTDRVL